MMVMTEGEDFMTYAEARGVTPRNIFLRYGVRNAMLPQVTSLALSLGTIVSQAVLVEVVFGYPGIGTLLYRSILGVDYFLIYGIVLLVVGLILALDVINVGTSVVDEGPLGWIFIVVGALAIVLALVMNQQRTRTTHVQERRYEA